MSSRYLYVRKHLAESGIDFSKIPKENLLVTCRKYCGTITKENFDAAMEAIDNIYENEVLQVAGGN